MDFGSDSWGEDDSWGDDNDDGWKRKKREAKETAKRKAETVEKTRKKRRVVDEEVETEEENKRVRREAAAKWRKGTQVCPVSSAKYLSQTFVSENIFIFVPPVFLIFALGVPARGGRGGQGGEVQAGSKLHGHVAS